MPVSPDRVGTSITVHGPRAWQAGIINEYLNVPAADKDKVITAARRLLVELGREIFDEEIADDTGLLVSDVRSALTELDSSGLTITPRADGSITVEIAER